MSAKDKKSEVSSYF